MKKIICSLFSLILLINISFAASYNVKVTIKGVDLVVTREAGNIVQLEKKLDEITGWRVLEGNVQVVNNHL